MPMHALPGTLTHAQIAEEMGRIQALRPASVDAAALRTFDSSAIALLIHCRAQGIDVHHIPGALKKLIHAYGIEALFV